MIIILLSVYHGETFLPQLVKSLESQTCPPDLIFVRDDGISEASLNILNSSAIQIHHVVDELGNLGPRDSFYQLMQYALNCCSKEDVFLFCDQDDVWHENKIEMSIRCLADIRGPAMYCHGYQRMDAQGVPIGPLVSPKVKNKFSTIHVWNPYLGCCIAFNYSALRAVESRLKKYFTMHDRFIAAFCAIFGTIVTDHNSLLWYRIHGTNASGATSTNNEIIAKVKRYLNGFLRKTVVQAVAIRRMAKCSDQPDLVMHSNKLISSMSGRSPLGALMLPTRRPIFRLFWLVMSLSLKLKSVVRKADYFSNSSREINNGSN